MALVMRCGLHVALSGVVGKVEVRDSSVRNYSAKLGREGIGLRDSYERRALGDTE